MLKVKEVADFFRVKELTIYRWLHAGKLKGMKVGREWRIPEEEVKRLVEEGIKKAMEVKRWES